MNLLAIDTSTETMSVAVQRTLGAGGAAAGSTQVWQHSGPGGAQTSANLIPAIQRLMTQADLKFAALDAIVFGSGPGSFTGLRTACSVAQGLAFGANLKVLPIDTLLAVSEEARWQYAPDLASCQVMALLDARMDEMYAAGYLFQRGQWSPIDGCRLIRPQDLVCHDGCILAGNVFATYGARLSTAGLPRVEALPTASAMLRLAPARLAAGQAVTAEQALPFYVRDKVAKTTLERAAEKAAL